MESSPPFVGVDVSKATLDVALSTEEATWRGPNSEAGIQELLERLKPVAPALVVIKATGGFETATAAALAAAEIPVVIASARYEASLTSNSFEPPASTISAQSGEHDTTL